MTRCLMTMIAFAAVGALAACGGGGDGGQVTNQDLPDATPPDLQGQDLPGQDLQQPDPGPPNIPAGNGTCVDIFDCVDQKQCQDQACVQECLAVGSTQAQNQFEALGQCLVSKCGQFQDQPAQQGYCVYAECKAENLPCTKTGDLGCMDMLECAEKCGEDDACVLDCFSQGTYDAQTSLFNILACIEKNCPTGDEDCIFSNCMQQVLACQNS